MKSLEANFTTESDPRERWRAQLKLVIAPTSSKRGNNGVRSRVILNASDIDSEAARSSRFDPTWQLLLTANLVLKITRELKKVRNVSQHMIQFVGG